MYIDCNTKNILAHSNRFQIEMLSSTILKMMDKIFTGKIVKFENINFPFYVGSFVGRILKVEGDYSQLFRK